MRVLVTGGAGFVGSICTECLLAAGHDVAVVDNLQTGHREAVPSDAQFFEGNFADRELISRLVTAFQPDGVMHFAAETLVDHSLTRPRVYFENNLQRAVTFLNLLLDLEVKSFIFSSTAAVYGNPETAPIPEEHPTRPINSYGESKLMFEKVLEWYRRAYGLRYIAMRYFNACGATENRGEHHVPETHLIPRILDAIEAGTEMAVYGHDYPTSDGTCVRDYVHVRDIAQAHILAMEALAGGSSGIYNIGTGSGNSVTQVIQVAERVAGRPLRTRVAPRRAGDPAMLVASNTKLRNELGWQPQHSNLEEIIRSAWEWKTRRPDGYSLGAAQSGIRAVV